AAHAVIARAVGAADDDGEFWHAGGGDRCHKFGAVASDAAGLVLLADHEAGDILQEQQRDLPLAAELDEVRAFERAFGKQNAVVGDDADRIATDMGEAANERLAIELL